MSIKPQMQLALESARRMTESVLEQFTTEESFFFQPHPKANHAIWVAGHLGLADNMFASKFRPDTANKPDGWDELFWFGSEIKDRSAYPQPAEVLSYMRNRRENLMKVLGELTDDELSAPGPGPDERSPIAGAPNIGQMFFFAAYHEGIHFGQLTVCHRGLGLDPIYQPQTAEAS